MSEKILKALMQLFAIIARPQGNDSDRRGVVEAFLRRQLNDELVKEYLGYFDGYFQEAMERQKKSNQDRRTSAISVRLLKICNDINDQLTQDQKVIVLVQLLEFCKSDVMEVSQLEQEFIQAVSESFNVDQHEHNLLKSFTLNHFLSVPKSNNVLIIDNKREEEEELEVKHLYNKDVKGKIWVL